MALARKARDEFAKVLTDQYGSVAEAEARLKTLLDEYDERYAKAVEALQGIRL